MSGWRFDNTYARLPSTFHAPATPARVAEPRVSILNERLADELGLRLTPSPETAATLTGQTPPPGAEPIAQAYAGHQYGGFTMLGDGRTILLGEHRTPDGLLVDIQLKGAGPTRFSRGGDGRAALGPMLREYVISEAMHALGIPTTRSLAVVTTGEPVFRTTPLRGAVLTRIAASHLRVGTFEYAVRRGEEAIRTLADYAIARHDPTLADSPTKYLDFFRAVLERQASLIARWQLVGFVHGVMNTDNMAISGETIDYGPCAFMDAYDPATVFSSIDHGGRYAYGNQPPIAQWNLARFAETLVPLIDPVPERAVELATEGLHDFARRFEEHWLAGMRSKLGLATAAEGDAALVQDLLNWMRESKADFTNTFRELSPTDGVVDDHRLRDWHDRWRSRLSRDGGSTESAVALMRRSNPAVIPRNHRVEEALTDAEEREDLAAFSRLVRVVSSPFDEGPETAHYREPSGQGCGYRTFCGT